LQISKIRSIQPFNCVSDYIEIKQLKEVTHVVIYVQDYIIDIDKIVVALFIPTTTDFKLNVDIVKSWKIRSGTPRPNQAKDTLIIN